MLEILLTILNVALFFWLIKLLFKLIQYEELFVPENEAIEGPYLLHIAVFTLFMLVKKLYKYICIKKFFRSFAYKIFLYDIIIFI